MTAPVLTVSGVGKAFRRYKREMHRILSLCGISMAPSEERWVLRDINFAVEPGQAVGIVGRNGAGKSTLLKLITGTMRQTTGTIAVNGRISAILELGMGFNMEFTGRQNAFQAAGMMGFNQSEIEGVIAEIEDFAELGDYFEQPIRVYSSGMQVRLAFAVATAFRPEVLIVDEALSVGDAYFQYKCFDRIRSFRKQGTTLILVSHDKAALQSICDRAILLEAGKVAKDGSPEEVLDYYNALIAAKEGEEIETIAHPSGRVQTISGDRRARIESVALYDSNGTAVETVAVGKPVELRVTARAHADLEKLVLGFALKDRLGQTMFGTNTFFADQSIDDVTEGETFSFGFRFDANLGPGNYSVSLALSGGESHLVDNYEWRDLAMIFTVVNLGEPFDGKTYIPTTVDVVRGADKAIST
ncbi:sugar ABC transporter ATP-binding protein [Devosia pacifica]|uniref:Sugar ABC transporter ATP-binding protein n=1 Tax=Devosia pacifica TaxID=1335967 RepID=A0A918SA99_9HYPH|nr:ABC transporter ATP-binding protein [Devosia pacifica]GHA32600.1 sugar ABC transporter ATP-binding protein [Devosia pacifica]